MTVTDDFIFQYFGHEQTGKLSDIFVNCWKKRIYGCNIFSLLFISTIITGAHSKKGLQLSHDDCWDDSTPCDLDYELVALSRK